MISRSGCIQRKCVQETQATHVVDGVLQLRQVGGNGVVDDDLAVAPTQVRQGVLCRVYVTPKVNVLRCQQHKRLAKLSKGTQRKALNLCHKQTQKANNSTGKTSVTPNLLGQRDTQYLVWKRTKKSECPVVPKVRCARVRLNTGTSRRWAYNVWA